MKNLICFAYRGEAQTFLKNLEARSKAFFFGDLFETEEAFILLTGEGPQNASEKLAAVLAAFHSEINLVINFGICADLRPRETRIELRDVKDLEGYWVRTSYLARSVAGESIDFEFRSFSSRENSFQKSMDCITVFERVFNPAVADKLSVIAPLADRELWGLASVCQTLKKPFCSYKLISDRVFDGTNPPESVTNTKFDYKVDQGVTEGDVEACSLQAAQGDRPSNDGIRSNRIWYKSITICEVIRQKAEIYSDHFFQIWNETIAEHPVITPAKSKLNSAPSENSNQSEKNLELESHKHFVFKDKDFHFTASMESHFNRTWHRLKLEISSTDSSQDLGLMNNLGYTWLKNQKMSGKERGRQLLLRMDQKLNPLDWEWQVRLKQLLLPLTKVGLHYLINEETEDIEIKILHNLSNTDKSLEEKLRILNNFNWQEIHQLLNGKSHV